MSVTRRIFETALEETEKAGAGRLLKVRVVAGDLLGLVPESMIECFRLLAQGTVAEGAALTVTAAPITARCRTCEHTFPFSGDRVQEGSTGRDAFATCPRCGGELLELLTGRELYIETIEVE